MGSFSRSIMGTWDVLSFYNGDMGSFISQKTTTHIYTRFLLREKSRSREGVGLGRFGELEFSILKCVFSVYYRFLKLRWSPAIVGCPAPYKHGVTTPYETRPMGEVVQSHRVRGVVCHAVLVST